jgi:hypothetical protein
MYKYVQSKSMYQTKTTVSGYVLNKHTNILKIGARLIEKISVHFTKMTTRNWNLPYETVPDLKPWTTGIFDSSK